MLRRPALAAALLCLAARATRAQAPAVPPAAPALAAPAQILAAAPAQIPPAAPPLEGKARAAALVEQARPLAAAKDWKAVGPLAEDAVRADGDNAEAHALAGLTLHAAKKWAKAAIEFDKAAQLGLAPGQVARAAAECADKRRDRARQAKWWLLVAKEEKDSAAALKAAHAAEQPQAVAEAYEAAQALGKLPKEELLPFARAEEAAGAPQKAAPLFDAAAAANPASLELALDAARIRIALDDLPAAEAQLRKLSAAHPQEPGVLLLSSQLAAARGDAPGERKLLEALLAQSPKYAPGLLRLGKLLLAGGDLPDARARFAAAAAAAPGDPEAHRLLAEAALAARDVPAALAAAKSAQKLAPKDPATSLILGRAAYASDDLATALPALEAGRKLATAEGLVELGDSYRRGKQTARARAALNEALRRDASPALAARAHELLGDVAMAEGKGPEAVQEYGRAAKGREKDVPFLVKQASAADLAGNAESAAAALDGILAAQPGDLKASVLRAKIHRDQKAPEKAAALLAPVAEKNPKDAGVLAALAQARLESGDAPGAKAAAEKALSVDASSALAHDVLGRVLYAAGKGKEALPHLEAAAAAGERSSKRGVASGPEASGDALVALADLDQTAGKKDAARALVARAKAVSASRLAVVQARMQAKDGDLNGAEKTLGPYLAAHPDDGDAQSAGADIAYDRGSFKVARERFEKAMAKTIMTPAALGRLCDLRVKDGAFAEAKDACKSAIAGGNDAPGVHASLGLALYKTGDKAGAKAELKGAAQADKNGTDVQTHGALGAIAAEEGDEKTALAEYELVLKQQKGNVEANAVTGRLLEKKGNHKEAAVRLGRAFAQKSDDANLGADLAKAQLGSGNLPGAQKTLAQLRTDALDPAVLHGLKGRVENGLGNYKKAHDEYQKALLAKPGDAELLALDGENFLKLPDYDKAIGSLEASAKADPARLDVQSQLTKLYAETGQTQKAGESLQRVDALEKARVEKERGQLDPKTIKRFALGDAFKSAGKESPAGFALALRGSVAADLARSPRLVLVETKNREDVAKERDRLLEQMKDASPEAIDKLVQQQQATQGVVSGLYALEGESFSLSVEIHDLQHNLLAGATESGAKKDYAQLEKKVALKLLDGLGVLTADERAQLERLEGVTAPNLDSFALAGAAQDAQKHGDARAAADLFQRARDTDQGNAQALVGLEKSLAEVEKKNQIAIPSPQSLGEISDAEREMFRRTLTDRLAPLKGLKVIEQSRVKEVDDELDRIMDKDKDNIDPKSIDLQAIGKKLAATVLVRSTMQREGDHVSYSASLIDITDQKLLTGAQVDGPRADEQKLQADLAKQIVQRLRGDPTDEEKLALEATLKADDYQKKMGELSRLLEKEKGEKAAAAAAKKAEDERTALAGTPKAAPLALADAGKLKEAEAAALKPAAQKAPTVAQLFSTEGGALDVFQLSARGSRVSPAGESGTMLGLVLSHYAKRTPHARYALLLDLESTRLKGRDSSNQTAWYAAGGDFTLPIDFRGTGLFLGASAMVGYSQLQRASAPSVVSGGLAVSLEPHAGIALAVHGLAVTGDLGYRLPFFLTGSVDNASTGLRGPYLQVGIRTETSPGHDSGGEWVLGYTARALVPNGSTVARKYSTSTIVGGGALLQHAIQISKQSHNTTSGLWVSYGGQSAGAGDSISRTEASWLYLWHAFSAENFIDPFLGFRLGASYFKGDTLYGNTDAHLGLLGAPMVGVDFQLARAFVLRAGASYDAVLGKSTPSDQDLQGYSLDAGAMLRF